MKKYGALAEVVGTLVASFLLVVQVQAGSLIQRLDEIRNNVASEIEQANSTEENEQRDSNTAWFDRDALTGHRLGVIKDGRTLLQKRLEFIQAARYSVYLSTYIFDEDQTGLQVASALCAKARQGLDVRLIVDSNGSKGFYSHREAWLRSCGVGVILYNPPYWDLANVIYTMHEKILVIDGVTVFIGGNGVQNAYHHVAPAHKFFHDMDVIVLGPAACWFHRSFIEVFKASRRSVPDFDYAFGGQPTRRSDMERRFGPYRFRSCRPISYGDGNVLPVYGNPLFEARRPILDRYLEAMRSTDNKIQLYAPYFVPDDKFVAGLLAAKARGVDVTVITNSVESNDEGWAPLVGMVYKVGKLMDAGINIRLWQGPKTLHRKVGIYDNKSAKDIVYIGSDNLDSRGQHYNSESLIFTDDRGTVRTVKREFRKDLENTIPLTRQYFGHILEKRTNLQKWFIQRILRFL